MLSETDYAAQAIELMRALNDGHKISAIKAFRMLTGHGLKESKEQVEAVMNRHPDEVPAGHYSSSIGTTSSTATTGKRPRMPGRT